MPLASGIGLSLAHTQPPMGEPAGEIDLSLTLTQIADGRVFQRNKTDRLDGEVTVMGTIVGEATTIEVRALSAVDDEVVVDWQTLDDDPGLSSFGGTMTVPVGGPYYVEVRDAVATDVLDFGTTEFYVGAWIVAYGQSNMAGLFGISGTPAEALPGTGYFDRDTLAFTDPPANPAVRGMLNTMLTLTGVPVAAVHNAIPAVVSAALAPGNSPDLEYDHFGRLLELIDAVGGDAEVIIVRQGEGDAHGLQPAAANYKANWLAIHTAIAEHVGRTPEQIPMLMGGLASFGGDVEEYSEAWWGIQSAMRELAAEHPGIVYSHSAVDLPRGDEFHITEAGLVSSGQRFAYTFAWLSGDLPADPAWSISAIEALSATTTLVTLAHGLGSDFSPSSAITGFEVSTDGDTWIDAVGARQSATTILLSHAALTWPLVHPADRLGRYQYGSLPDVSGAVHDNSAIGSPLSSSASQLLIDLAPPAMTSDSAVEVDEGETYITTLAASRPSSFAITGVDAGLVEQVVNGGDIELHFLAAPDYDDPEDAGADNVAHLVVTPTALDNGDVGSGTALTISILEVGSAEPTKAFVGWVTTELTGDAIRDTHNIGAAAGKLAVVAAAVSVGQPAAPVVTVGTDTLELVATSAIDTFYYLAWFAGELTVNGPQPVTVAFADGIWRTKIAGLFIVDGEAPIGAAAIADSDGFTDLSVAEGEFVLAARFGQVSSFSGGATEMPDIGPLSENAGSGSIYLSLAGWTVASTTSAFDLGLESSGATLSSYLRLA
jgi:hypothetical protein